MMTWHFCIGNMTANEKYKSVRRKHNQCPVNVDKCRIVLLQRQAVAGKSNFVRIFLKLARHRYISQ